MANSSKINYVLILAKKSQKRMSKMKLNKIYKWKPAQFTQNIKNKKLKKQFKINLSTNQSMIP